MAVVGDAYVVVRAITTNVLPDIQRGLNGVGRLGEGAGRELGEGINRGFSASGSQSFDNLRDRLEASRVQFRALNNAARFLGPAITGLVGAIGALVGGLVVLVATAGSAARALIVLPAALFALAQAAIATRLAFRGVSEAISAGLQAQQGSAAASRAQEAALRRVRDAQLALKRLLEEEAPEVLAAARERAADAARAAADALLSAERTQRSYNEAQLATLNATNAVTEARERAIEKLQQLRFQVEGAAISEARARLEFEKARDSLQAVQDLPPNSRARQEAELAFAQAELNLRKAIDSNADLKKEEDRATKAGVEGSEDVLSAKEALAKAQEREADLAIDTARAFQRAAEAQKDAADAAAAAAAGGTVERELNRRIAEAREALRDAQQAASEAASGGLNQFQQALSKLSPEAQAFVKLIVDLETNFKAFSQFTDAAGRLLFPQLSSAVLTFLSAAEPLKQLLEETGGVVGGFADKLATALFTGEGFESLKSVWGTNNTLLTNLSDAAVNLALAFLLILEAAEPLITAFGEWASSSSATFLADLRSDAEGLDEVFSNAERNFGLFSEIIGNVLSAFGVIGGVINEEGGAGQTLLEGLRDRSEDWLATLQEGAEDGSLNTLFQGLVDNFLQLFDLAYELGRVFLEIGAQPGVGQFIESIKNAVTTFGEIGVSLSAEDGPVAQLGKFVENFARLIQLATESGSIQTFFETLNDILLRAIEIFENPAVQQFFQTFGPIIAQFAAFGLAFRAVRLVVEAVLGTVLLLLSPVFALAGYLTALGNPDGGFMRFVGNLGRAFGIFFRILGIVGLIVSIIALAYQNSEQFREAVEGAVAGITNVFRNAFADIVEVFSGGNGFGPKTKEAFANIGEFIRGFFEGLGNFLGTLLSVATMVIGVVVGAISGAIQAIGPFIEAIIAGFEGIGDVFSGVSALLRGDWDEAMKFFRSGIENFASFFRNIWEGLVRIFKGIVNGFIDAWNGLATKIKFRFPEWLGGGEFALPTIPRLAEGGIVSPRAGGVLAQLAEAGRPERVEPLDPDGLSKRDKAMIAKLTGGGTGATINVYPSPGMDERELADLVSRRLAYQMRKGSV